MYKWIYGLLEGWAVPDSWLPGLTQAAMIAGVFAIALTGYYVAHVIISEVVRRIVKRTEVTWDDELFNDRLLRAGAMLVPAIIVVTLLPRCYDDATAAHNWLEKICALYMVFASIQLLCVFVESVYNMLDARERFRAYPLRSIYQIIKLLLIIIGVIIGISTLLGRDPLLLLSGVGASAAVLSLVFKDTIVGLVAGVQLSANDMLRKGDWIAAPKYNANGTVIDVTLTTVKVRNWDNSVSTIPPYALVSDSFQNWEAMKASGARRISRAIYIDVNTVKFCTPAQIERLRSLGMLADADEQHTAHTVNLKLLREYLENYLMNHPEVDTTETLMVRQLDPTPNGLPVELYFFSKTTEWVAYEHLQADIFDHVYASVQEFGLAIFQTPAGRDISALR